MNISKFLFAFVYIAAILSIFYGLWKFIPFFYKPPWISTAQNRARRALEMVNLQSGELFYDLGSGNGGIILMAAEEFGARAVGIEKRYFPYLLTKIKLILNGSKPNIKVRHENFHQTDLSNADVIFAYLTPDQTNYLQRNLENQLKEGARVVTITYNFPNWKPNDFDETHLIFGYKMPHQEGGLAAYLLERDQGIDLPYLDIS